MKTAIKLRIFLSTLLGVILIMATGCSKSPLYTESIEDVEGNKYGTMLIGNQLWMTKNLRVASFSDGSPMLFDLYDDAEWAAAGASCIIYPYYETDDLSSKEEVIDAYGMLYNWKVVNDSKGICPDGWRVPTKEDWEELVEFLGGEDVAGGKLKSWITAPASHPRWDSPNTGATDNYGFKAIPSGYRTSLGQFDYLGAYAEYWTSSEYDENFAHTFYLYTGDAALRPAYGKKGAGYAIRCILDN